MKDRLRQLASVHWIGVKFSEQQMIPTFDDQITFCDAITEAIVRSSTVLTEKNLKTDEMKFLLGWSRQLKIDSKKLVEDFSIAESITDKILINLSSIKKAIKSIIRFSERGVYSRKSSRIKSMCCSKKGRNYSFSEFPRIRKNPDHIPF